MLDIQNLKLATASAEDGKKEECETSPVIGRWRDEAPTCFVLSNCGFRLWLAHQQDFETFPDDEDHPLELCEKDTAYAYVLCFALGILGGEVDTHDRFQYRNSVKVLKTHYPDKADYYAKLLNQIDEDVKLIEKRWLSKLKSDHFGNVARDLSGQQKGETALLIAGMNKHGDLAQSVNDILQAVAVHKTRHLGRLIITNPDMSVMQTLESKISDFKHKIRAPLEFVFMDDALAEIEMFDRVYVSTMIGENAQADADLARVWQGSARTDATLTHMRGSPQNRGRSVFPLSADNLDNFTSPEDIRDEIFARQKENSLRLEDARRAAMICAQSRERGQDPKQSFVHPLGQMISDYD